MGDGQGLRFHLYPNFVCVGAGGVSVEGPAGRSEKRTLEVQAGGGAHKNLAGFRRLEFGCGRSFVQPALYDAPERGPERIRPRLLDKPYLGLRAYFSNSHTFGRALPRSYLSNPPPKDLVRALLYPTLLSSCSGMRAAQLLGTLADLCPHRAKSGRIRPSFVESGTISAELED